MVCVFTFVAKRTIIYVLLMDENSDGNIREENMHLMTSVWGALDERTGAASERSASSARRTHAPTRWCLQATESSNDEARESSISSPKWNDGGDNPTACVFAHTFETPLVTGSCSWRVFVFGVWICADPRGVKCGDYGGL